MKNIKESLSAMSDMEFENLTFDLMIYSGLRNTTWRTPGSDGGRDIEGLWLSTDLSQQFRQELWYVECKRYKASVSWPVVFEKIAYAMTGSADVLMLVTSAALSPNCKNEIGKWNAAKQRPFIQYLDGSRLSVRLSAFPVLLAKYGLDPTSASKGAEAGGVLAALVSACDAAEGELDGRFDSISSDAAFELARMIEQRSGEISLYGRFATGAGRAVPMPSWCGDDAGHRTIPANFRVFLAYFRFVARPRDIRQTEVRTGSCAVRIFDIVLPQFNPVGSNSLNEVSVWCGINFRIVAHQLILEQTDGS